jgi:DNA (cytosine-5)-methyltransferase 1
MKAVELFAGAGGLAIGVSRAGFQPIQIIERDKWCCDTLRENRKLAKGVVKKWPAPDETDIKAVSFQNLAGNVDLVTGGPPCQPFSLGGKHKAHQDDRDMWPEAVRAVREIQPKAFIFENVKGLTRETFATYLAYIVHQLTHPEIIKRRDESWTSHLTRLERDHTGARRSKSLEYRVVSRVLNAADYGVPQKRERIVFVGFRSDLEFEWSFPTPTHSQDALLWDQVRSKEYWDRHEVPKRYQHVSPRGTARAEKLLSRPNQAAWRTVRDAIGDLPDPERHPRLAGEIANHRFQAGARSYPGHTGSPLDEVGKTLKAGVHGVPGGENMLTRRDGTLRYFTVRESARLQTFPDDFVFHGSWSETMRQLGNAVPVDLAEAIARDVRKKLTR